MSMWRARLWKGEPESGKAQVVMGIKTATSRTETSGMRVDAEQAHFAAAVIFMKPDRFAKLKKFMEGV